MVGVEKTLTKPLPKSDARLPGPAVTSARPVTPGSSTLLMGPDLYLFSTGNSMVRMKTSLPCSLRTMV